MMNLTELREAFGTCTKEEVLAACHAQMPAIDDYEKAKTWLQWVTMSLFNQRRYKAARHGSCGEMILNLLFRCRLGLVLTRC
jgi:hypothetical protein